MNPQSQSIKSANGGRRFFHTIITHLRPHLDEMLGILLLSLFGESRYPGIRRAKVIYLSTETLPGSVTAKVMENRGVLPIGIGGGDLDEHPSNGNERKKEECASTLVAKKLDLRDDRWWRIVTEIKECDLTARVTPTQLASLVKMRYRHNRQYKNVRCWAEDALLSLHKTGAHRPDRGSCKGIVDKFESIARKNDWNKNEDKRAYNQTREFLIKSQEKAHNCLTELAHLHHCVGRTFPQNAEEWTTIVLDELYQDSVEFFKTVDQINAVPPEHIGEIDLLDCQIPLLMIETDSELLNKAARSKWTGIFGLIIQKSSRGNIGVYLNTLDDCVRRTGTNLIAFVQMVRWTEITKQGGEPPIWRKLSADGTLKECPKWHFLKHANMALNGSLTTPKVEGTSLSSDEFSGIAACAFKPELVKLWCDTKGINQDEVESDDERLRIALEKNTPVSDGIRELERILDESITENGK